MKVKKITANKAKCLKCQTVIESVHRHDFVRCKCGAVFVDGGKDYLRRGGTTNLIEELSEYEEVQNYAERRKDGIIE